MKLSAIVVMLVFSKLAYANDESLDLAFLEWLAQTAELDELDIELLMQEQKLKQDSEQKAEESSK